MSQLWRESFIAMSTIRDQMHQPRNNICLLPTTLGDTEVSGTDMDSIALDYPFPGSTIYNVAVENGFSTNTPVLESRVNNGLHPSSSYQCVGNALQLTEPKLQTQMIRAVSTDKRSNLLKSVPSSFNAADLPEEGHAQFCKPIPGAFELPVQKRVAEHIFALQSKKTKTDPLLQTLDQMNGIMSECGVNTTEEEAGMLPKLTERRRPLVQEERGSLFLEKKPLLEKLTKLANDWGVPFVNEDVELCLSLSLEEFLRRIFDRLVRYSDQSQDMVEGDQKFLVTSDAGAQIRMLRQKATEALKAKELAEPKKAGNLYNENKKLMEAEAAPKLKSQTRKNNKAKDNATEVAPMRTAETDQMLIKWQIMAEQARRKQESEGSLSLQKKSELAGTSSTAASGRPVADNSQALTAQPQREITVNDLISVLEMDAYMAKSTLLYQFYDRVRTKLQQ